MRITKKRSVIPIKDMIYLKIDFIKNECQNLGLRYNMRDIIIDYKHGYADKQLSLFGEDS